MCGIVSICNLEGKPVNHLVKSQYLNQKSRGSEGFGLFDYEYKNMVHEPQEKNIFKWLDKYPSSNILFHHRLPTSTANVKNACHPFSTKDFFRTNYVLVHNGIIYNDLELKDKHEKLGIKYSSEQPNGDFNDSEALLWEVALFLEGKQDKIDTEGAVAFICMAIGKGNKHDRLWFARNTNPLNILWAEDGFMLSSEGDGEPIEPKTLYSYDYVNGKLTKQEIQLDSWRSWQSETIKKTNNTLSGLYPEWEEDDELKYMGYVKDEHGVYVKDVEDYADSAYDNPDWADEPNKERGSRLVRLFKQAEQARLNDCRLIMNSLADKCEGWVYDMQLQLEWEFDCLYLYREHCEANQTSEVAHVNYTLERYIDVSEELEELWQEDTRQLNGYAQRRYA